MLGKIRITKRGSGLIRIIECSLLLLLRKGFRVIERIKIPKLTAEEFKLSKNSNYRESTIYIFLNLIHLTMKPWECAKLPILYYDKATLNYRGVKGLNKIRIEKNSYFFPFQNACNCWWPRPMINKT